MREEWPHLAGRLEGGAHVLPVRVYYEDTDFSGVVYHASYLRFLERGRTDFLRLGGVDQSTLHAAGEGVIFAVRRMTVDFLKPARMDDVLIVRDPHRRGEGGLARHRPGHPARRRNPADGRRARRRHRRRAPGAHLRTICGPFSNPVPRSARNGILTLCLA